MNHTEETKSMPDVENVLQGAEPSGQNENERPDNSAETAQEAAQETSEEVELKALKAQLEDARNKYIYLLADFDNYKRNAIRERENLRLTAGADVITAMLSVIDDFERALKDETVGEGIRLIHHKLLHTLQSKGLVSMDAKSGDILDADRHEAIAAFPAEQEEDKGKIVEVVEQGYTLNGKIIRHAKVVVAQ